MEERVNIFTTISDEQFAALCDLGYRTPEIIYALMHLENGKLKLMKLLNMHDDSFDAFVEEVFSKLTEKQRVRLSEEPKSYCTGLILEEQEDNEN